MEKNKKKIKAIIFDIGGVIQIYQGKEFCRYLEKKFGIKEDLFIMRKNLQHLYNLDNINSTQYYNEFRKKGIKLSKKEFFEIYYNKYTKINYALLNFMGKKLYSKYDLYLFSNNNRLNIKELKKRINTKLFKTCIYSYDLKIKKPDIKFFEQGLKLIKQKGSDCIFIDDQLKSKEPSESLGITFIQYKNLNQLKKELKNII